MKYEKGVGLVLTEKQVNLIINALREVHTPDRIRPMADEPAALLQSMEAVMSTFLARKKAKEELLQSMTDDEVEFIISRRKGGG